MPDRPTLPTYDPFDDIPAIGSGPMPECLRNPNPSPAVMEDARREMLREIRSEWPELAGVLGGPQGRLVAFDTLEMIVRDLFRTPQD